MMQPVDFVKEMIGIVKMIPEGTAPTLEQWTKIVDSLGEAMGYVVKKRMDEMEQEDRYRVQQQGYPIDKLYGYAQGGGMVTMSSTAGTACVSPIYGGGLTTTITSAAQAGAIIPVPKFSIPSITLGSVPAQQMLNPATHTSKSLISKLIDKATKV